MSQMIAAFLPSTLATVVIGVTAAASATRLPIGTPNQGGPSWRQGGEYIRVTNMAAALGPNIFFETFNAAQPIAATTTTSTVVTPGQTAIFRRAPGDDFISAIADAAGPTNFIVTVGNGI